VLVLHVKYRNLSSRCFTGPPRLKEEAFALSINLFFLEMVRAALNTGSSFRFLEPVCSNNQIYVTSEPLWPGAGDQKKLETMFDIHI